MNLHQLRTVARAWIAVAGILLAREKVLSDEIYRTRFDTDCDQIFIRMNAKSDVYTFVFDTLKHFTAVDVSAKRPNLASIYFDTCYHWGH